MCMNMKCISGTEPGGGSRPSEDIPRTPQTEACMLAGQILTNRVVKKKNTLSGLLSLKRAFIGLPVCGGPERPAKNTEQKQ